MKVEDSDKTLCNKDIKKDNMNTKQNENIIEEVESLNKEMIDPSYVTFKKSTYWNKQSSGMVNNDLQNMFKQFIGKLTQIEEKLIKIVNILEEFNQNK